MEPNFTEEEFEILYGKVTQDDRYITGLFLDYNDREDLKSRILAYKEIVLSSSEGIGKYRNCTNSSELFTLKLLSDILFGDISLVPLQLNRYFKEAAKYRLEIGK
jgi:hypothetical protein